jgi:hypothetical protein
MMKTSFSKLLRLPWAVCLAVWGAEPPASAQSPPRLGLQFYSGQPSLTITGTAGTVYSIQYASDLSPTNHWTDRTLFQVRGTNDVWTDPSAPAPSQRFYRAVCVPAPADTNLVFIQSGTFTMGSPISEAERYADGTSDAPHNPSRCNPDRRGHVGAAHLSGVESAPRFERPLSLYGRGAAPPAP